MPYRDKSKKLQYDRSFYHQRMKPRRPYKQDTTPGKRSLITFRLDDTIIARVQQMRDVAIATGQYPWKTSSQWWRALIVRGLETLKGTSQVADEAAPYIDMLKRLEAVRLPRIEAQSTLHKATEEINELLEIGAEREAVQLWHTTMETARGLSPTRWQQWLIEELERRYPQLAAQEPRGVHLRRVGKKQPGPTAIRAVK